MAETAPRLDSNGPTVVVIAAVFGAITFVAVSLRLFTKAFIQRQIGADDCKVSRARKLDAPLTCS